MASLVLMPSRSEPFGLVALEAIATGTPVLVSSESGLAEYLRQVQGDRFIVKINGSLDKKDAKALYKAIWHIINPEELQRARTHIEEIRTKYQQKFSEERSINTFARFMFYDPPTNVREDKNTGLSKEDLQLLLKHAQALLKPGTFIDASLATDLGNAVSASHKCNHCQQKTPLKYWEGNLASHGACPLCHSPYQR